MNEYKDATTLKGMVSLFAVGLAIFSIGTGCNGNNGEEENPDVEGCEHLQQGPAVAVTAAVATAGAPGIFSDHKRYDVTLTDITGGKGGLASYAASEAADYVFFLSANIPLKFVDASSQESIVEESATSSPVCADIKGRHVVELGVGTYYVSFGPTTEASVSVVIEEAAEH